MKEPEKRLHWVSFIDEKARLAFEELKEGKFEDKGLYNFIRRALVDLKKNPFCGIQIQKRLWPKEYVKKYGIKNLWKYDLPNGWRLVYFLRGDSVQLVAIILEWFDHPHYERRFGY